LVRCKDYRNQLWSAVLAELVADRPGVSQRSLDLLRLGGRQHVGAAVKVRRNKRSNSHFLKRLKRRSGNG
jgi:hypothetical protein